MIYDTIAENKENGEIVHFRGRIPFTHGAELSSEIDSSAIHSVSGHCNEIKISDGGDKYLLDAEILLEIDSVKNGRSMLTQDIFVPYHSSEVLYRNFKYETLFKNGCERLTINENINLKDADEDENEIIDYITSIKLDPIKQNGETAAICGNIKARIIYKTRGEYSSHDISLPFSADIGNIPSEEERAVTVYPVVCDVHCRIKGKEATLETDIILPYVVMQRKSIRIANSIKVGDKIKNTQSGITVYYPEKNENPWSVAKKFGISLSALATLNGINIESPQAPIVGKRFLMIS